MALASITHDGGSYTFRTNPNQINWTYNLNKAVDDTYGGRVIQLLSVNMDNLIVTADAGGGGWPHLERTILFFRDLLVSQRQSGRPAIFEYPTRGWKFSIYALSMPMADAYDQVRREFTMNFKIQEDVSMTASIATLDAELKKLQEGIGYTVNKYNEPTPENPGGATAPGTPTDTPTSPDPTAPNPTGRTERETNTGGRF